MSKRTLKELLNDMRRYDYARESVVYGKAEAIVRRAAEVAEHYALTDESPQAAILADAGLEDELASCPRRRSSRARADESDAE